MSRLLAIAAVVGLLLVPALPAQSLQASGTQGGSILVVWIKSDGTSGVSGLNDFQDAGADAAQACGGIAPVVNSCTLQDHSNFPYGGSWSVGFIAPYSGFGPGGAFFGSTVVNLTGSKTVVGCCWTVLDQPYSHFFGCNWYFVNVLGYWIGDANCGTINPSSSRPTGDLTAKFHAGALDGRLPVYGWPTSNDLEVGVGNWAGVLTAS